MSDTFLDFDENAWGRLKKNLKKVNGDIAYNNWLKHLNFLSFEQGILSLSVPTKFLRDWLVNNYADKIKLQCKKSNFDVEALKIVVKPIGGRIVPGTARIIKDNDRQWDNTLDIRNTQTYSSATDFGAPLDPRYNI